MNKKTYFDPRDYRTDTETSNLDSRVEDSRDDSYDQPEPRPSYLDKSQFYDPDMAGSAADVSMMGDEMPGIALRAVKDKWTELGPLKLEEILDQSDIPIDQSLKFGQSSYNKYLVGQVGKDGRIQGVGKEINHIIYEGQFKNDIYHGYGRYIYSNGNYYIGNWVDGKRQGRGKLVDKSGKVYEGMWQFSKFVGNKY